MASICTWPYIWKAYSHTWPYKAMYGKHVATFIGKSTLSIKRDPHKSKLLQMSAAPSSRQQTDRLYQAAKISSEASSSQRERVDWSSDWQQMDTALPVGGRLKKILSMNVSLLRTWILDGCSLLPFTAHWWNESGSCHAYQESGQVARYRPKWPGFHIEKIFWGEQ